jgi:uncharacterized protein (DUF1810 family)
MRDTHRLERFVDAQICPDDPMFMQAIDKYYGGEFDALTVNLLRS